MDIFIFLILTAISWYVLTNHIYKEKRKMIVIISTFIDTVTFIVDEEKFILKIENILKDPLWEMMFIGKIIDEKNVIKLCKKNPMVLFPPNSNIPRMWNQKNNKFEEIKTDLKGETK